MKQDKENRFSGMTPEEIKLEARRQIVRSTFLALAALIVIVVACYAWFANNKTVSANLGQVSVNADCFELASEGMAGGDNTLSIVPTEYRNEGEDWGTDRGTQTGNEKQSILWRMNNNSHIGNLAKSGSGIRPGAKGKLEFYVIPKRSSAMTIHAYLDVIPYKETKGTPKVLTEVSNETIQLLLRGHLLFSYKVGDKAQYHLVQLSDGGFSIDIPEGSQEVKVTIEWYWPYLLSHAEKYDSTIAGLIVGSLNGDPQYFLYDEDGTLSEYAGKVTSNNLGSYLKRLGAYYNNADQQIGDNVDSIVLRLRAEAA